MLYVLGIWWRSGRIEGLAPRLVLSPEQSFGGIAVGGGLQPVRFHPGNLGLEKFDPLLQLCLRIRAEILTGELARCVAFGPGTIIVFHLQYNPPLPGCCQQAPTVMHRSIYDDVRLSGGTFGNWLTFDDDCHGFR